MTDYTNFLPAIGADTDFYDKYSDLLDALNTDIDSVTDYTDFLPEQYVDTDFAVKFAGLLQALDNDLPSPTISYISKLPAIGADKDFAINYSAILTALNEEDFIGAPSDPEWANVSLLIYGDENVTDETGKTITINGNISLSSAQAKFGDSSIYFDGNGDYLQLASSTDFGFGTGDFTIEGWFYNTGASGVDYLLDFRTASSSAVIYLAIYNGTNLMVRNGSGGDIIYTRALTTNTWFHLAAVRSGGTLYAYVDGIMVQSKPYTTNLPSSPINIGANLSGASNYSGYMENIRITKGVARYTSNFTPPTEPFPNS